MRRATVSAALGITLLASVSLPSAADAAILFSPGLMTLVTGSDAIVLAERLGTRTLTGASGRSITLTRYRVKKVYSGALLPGEEIELHDNFNRKGIFGDDVTFDPTTIIFLVKAKKGSRPILPPEERTRFAISGLRLTSENRVYGFQQGSNPGPLCPTRLVRQLPNGGSTEVTVGDFEQELRRSIARVVLFRQAKLENDPVKRRRRILTLLKPYETGAAHVGLDRSWNGSALLQQMIDTFLQSGDIEGALEVFARTEAWYLSFDVDTALRAAADRSLGSRARVAAIRSLESKPVSDRGSIERLVALAVAGNASVSLAARQMYRWLHLQEFYRRRGVELAEFWHRALRRIESVEMDEIMSSAPRRRKEK